MNRIGDSPKVVDDTSEMSWEGFNENGTVTKIEWPRSEQLSGELLATVRLSFLVSSLEIV